MRSRTWYSLWFLSLGGLLACAIPAPKVGDIVESRRGSHPKVGEVVVDFSLEDVKGKEVKLSDFQKRWRKKIFVLELGACT